VGLEAPLGKDVFLGRSVVSSGPFFNLKELQQMSIKPRQPVPALEFDTIGAGRWRLFDQKPSQFSMIVFYRACTARYVGSTPAS